MERHRHDEVEMAAAEARVVQGFAQPGGNRMAEMALLCVLELMDEAPNRTPAAVGRDSAIEVKDAMLAVGATKSLGDGARKRLRAFRTERCRDPGRVLLAITAQVFRARYAGGANHAGRRVKER